MTDKQIIIDGVDVSGCEYIGLYKECKLKCGSCYPVDCSDNPNCYYKQLKRAKNQIVDLNKMVESKEQECEQLKTWFDDEQIDNDKLQQFYQDEHCDNLKLKQTITEIKKIVEECYYKCNSMNNCNISCKYYNNCNGEFSYLLDYLNKQSARC